MDCIAREYGFTVQNVPRKYRPATLGFYKEYKYRRPYSKTLKPHGYITIDVFQAPTIFFLGHPRMRVVIENEQYEEDAPYRSDDLTLPSNGRGKIDLADPESIPILETLFKRVDEEILGWCKEVVKRHEIGVKLRRKQRKSNRRTKNGRRNR